MNNPSTTRSVATAEAGQPSVRYRCPNCARRFLDLTAAEHTESGCFLGLLIDVVIDREVGSVDSAQVAAFEDVDGLWDRFGGPAADELEAALRPRALAVEPSIGSDDA